MFSDDTYRTIKAISTRVYKEKSSKFIAIAIPVKGEEEVNEQLRTINKDHHDANHRCFAYRLGFSKEIFRFSDDGEPSGTAGKPIYGQLLSFDLTNILVVVVRHFGGIKLGVSGLINAYKTATRELLNDSEIITKTINDIFDVEFEYENMNTVMRILKESDTKPFENSFENKCCIKISIRKSKSDQVIEKLKKINNLTYNHIQII
jgi:uncharacterized YigZ family protein